ncbi:hypothetical protein [Legionella maceachernii]|uniref:Uncharacterized protein n=1 Tax=Legionella maceachernii TaxID=466 RepID=A0A0W0WCD9_9GAMM|nr:hypothetical protein [Legionella maceachernii]KTD29670.1 hypothetical protein Lmac_0845 [Legionella maceachernii]SKA20982.1 hypothetical protein SAMN02745128_02588 [Legionella maceachernii]SUP02608.1 Uncharacterised protein [Legionella maceachernii]
MSLLSKLFGGGGGKSPMDAANQYLNQIPGVGHQGYDPYINAGMDASGRTKSKYEELMSDPTAFINKLMEGYKPSEGYQFQKDQLTKELSNTAAAGGVAGTPMDQLNQGEQIQGLLGKDMQQFLQNILGVFNTGLEGEEGIANRGYDASKNLTDLLGGALNQQGGLAFQDQQQKNKNKNDLWSMFGKALGAGAGGLLGGVPGAKIGAGIFG